MRFLFFKSLCRAGIIIFFMMFFMQMNFAEGGEFGKRRSGERFKGWPQIRADYANVKKVRISFDGYKRSYLVQVPQDYSTDRKYPVLMALHGGGGRGENFINSEKIFKEAVDRHQMIGVYPSGVDRQFNDGRTIPVSKAHSENIDDVGFLLEVIKRVSGDYAVDQDRIFVTGISNGGHMSFRMACEASEQIAGIAVNVAQLTEYLYKRCSPERPIPVVLFLGTEDPLIPYEGGFIVAKKEKRGKVLSAEDTVKFWVKANGCSQASESQEYPDVDRTDSSHVIREDYTNCQNHADVILYQIVGGGHTWPGGRQYFPKRVIGSVNRDINAVEEMLSVFNLQ